MTVAQTKKAFIKAIRDNVKARAAKKGITMTKQYMDDIALQQAVDTLAGDSARVLRLKLDLMLDMC